MCEKFDAFTTKKKVEPQKIKIKINKNDAFHFQNHGQSVSEISP